MWARHIELEVAVVRDDHEFDVAWSLDDGVVGPWEVHYLEL
jgi:hypothetical protein